MKDLPDLTGYSFGDAEKILKENEVSYVVYETSSPRNDIEGEEKRVVRQVIKNGVLNITLCRY